MVREALEEQIEDLQNMIKWRMDAVKEDEKKLISLKEGLAELIRKGVE